MKGWLSRYSPLYPRQLVYMLQASEYNVGEYLQWWMRTRDYASVTHRKQLDMTAKARLLLYALIVVMVVLWGAIALLLYWLNPVNLLAAALIVLGLPTILALAPLPFLIAGYTIIQRPQERRIIARATERARHLEATKIAVFGSYGKTTMKELLRTILSEKYQVAATPGNKNTPLGISAFIDQLSDKEEVVIFEYGEARVGDIDELCALTRPDYGVLTGASEAHLTTFGTREAIIETLFEASNYIDNDKMYKNRESDMLKGAIAAHDVRAYDSHGVGDWRAQDIDVTLEGLSFTIRHGSQEFAVRTPLIGRHLVGPIVACASLAHELGLSDEQIAAGIAKTVPFEYRMEPRHLHGALVIDDTYNGNPMGVKSGLALLRDADARRRIYVTPGLVELGDASDEIHQQIGEWIARSADVVYLMNNSTTQSIKRGLVKASYKGVLEVIDDPVEFYTNIEHYVAAGDVVLMQNDWSDNYA